MPRDGRNMVKPLTFEDFENMPTLGDIARYHGRTRPKSVALCFEGRSTTYSDFDRHTAQVANALLATGVKHGERIAYIGKNSDSYFELWFGAAKMGAVILPVGWRLAPSEIAYILADSETKMVFVGPEVRKNVLEAIAGFEAQPALIDMEGSDTSGFDAWRASHDTIDPAAQVETDDVAIQLYTSGTTGTPKGAMLTHDNLLAGTGIYQ